MKLDSKVVMRAQRYGCISTVDRDMKARQEQHRYEWYMIGTGFFACVNDAKVHVIEETQKTLGCSCMDMTHRCRPGEVCKHIIAFGNLLHLPVQPVPDAIAVLLRDQGWKGDRLLFPPANAAQEQESKEPKIRQPYTEPAGKKQDRHRFEGLTPDQMCRMMDDKELNRNAKKGGVAAIAEQERRNEEVKG